MNRNKSSQDERSVKLEISSNSSHSTSRWSNCRVPPGVLPHTNGQPMAATGSKAVRSIDGSVWTFPNIALALQKVEDLATLLWFKLGR